MERELNLLTQRLLTEGYTEDDHPDYVRVCRSGWGKELWENLAHGFEYTPEYLKTLVFKTGCGLLVKGAVFLTGSMSYMGVNWIPENDNPTITCPYRKDGCKLRNPILSSPNGGGLCKILFCDCHRTEESYCYENSVDKIRDDYDAEKKRKYDVFSERRNGHICHWHMYYSDWNGEWKLRYDPMECARRCLNVGRTCDLTHKPISKKKANIFYDRKITRIRRDGTLFDGEEMISIEKGIRFFDISKSVTICEEVLKRCKKDLIDHGGQKYKREMFCDKSIKLEILNLREEQRESRDLIQDLEDIRAGIRIYHASDLKKEAAQAKRDRRTHRQQMRIQKLEKKLLEVGYEALEDYSLDKIHADKWLGTVRLQELEQIRQKRLEEKEKEPVQLSLFDMGL